MKELYSSGVLIYSGVPKLGLPSNNIIVFKKLSQIKKKCINRAQDPMKGHTLRDHRKVDTFLQNTINACFTVLLQAYIQVTVYLRQLASH